VGSQLGWGCWGLSQKVRHYIGFSRCPKAWAQFLVHPDTAVDFHSNHGRDVLPVAREHYNRVRPHSALGYLPPAGTAGDFRIG
jgi:transposase InsO family protein